MIDFFSEEGIFLHIQDKAMNHWSIGVSDKLES